MLFNSYQFIFLFLPAVLAVYYFLGIRRHYRAAVGWLVFASLIFYGWWNPTYLLLIFASILFNFGLAQTLKESSVSEKSERAKALLIIGVGVNLAALAYFKYANFFVDNVNLIFSTDFQLGRIVLPLAISFFTFQQITYLVDTYKGISEEHDFLRYCLFVTFFPQLIAGPIVHHREMLPQFGDPATFEPQYRKLAVGVSIFFIGLAKKVVIADGVAKYATPVFDAALLGHQLSFFEAWGGALAYTFQLYFDFSGYSDMAVGLAFMCGVRLPLNFFSPYKAVNIIEFWRRWHITLSRFLRDYVYIPFGGNRRGRMRRHVNLLATMFLGGLWHGAAWTFVFWGALHGVFLVINHGWRTARGALGHDLNSSTPVGRAASRLVTFLAVVVGWVFFRAESFDAAAVMIEGMVGVNGFVLPTSYQGYFNVLPNFGNWLAKQGFRFEESVDHFYGLNEVIFLFAVLVTAWFAPNTYRLMGIHSPALDITHASVGATGKVLFHWRPNLGWALFIVILAFWSILKLDQTSEFLYYQF
jgi:D-alanyl-lipoteichoic acid acyltransferase DltB (MBOAT superfamily)